MAQMENRGSNLFHSALASSSSYSPENQNTSNLWGTNLKRYPENDRKVFAFSKDIQYDYEGAENLLRSLSRKKCDKEEEDNIQQRGQGSRESKEDDQPFPIPGLARNCSISVAKNRLRRKKEDKEVDDTTFSSPSATSLRRNDSVFIHRARIARNRGRDMEMGHDFTSPPQLSESRRVKFDFGNFEDDEPAPPQMRRLDSIFVAKSRMARKRLQEEEKEDSYYDFPSTTARVRFATSNRGDEIDSPLPPPSLNRLDSIYVAKNRMMRKKLRENEDMEEHHLTSSWENLQGKGDDEDNNFASSRVRFASPTRDDDEPPLPPVNMRRLDSIHINKVRMRRKRMQSEESDNYDPSSDLQDGRHVHFDDASFTSPSSKFDDEPAPPVNMRRLDSIHINKVRMARKRMQSDDSDNYDPSSDLQDGRHVHFDDASFTSPSSKFDDEPAPPVNMRRLDSIHINKVRMARKRMQSDDSDNYDPSSDLQDGRHVHFDDASFTS
eukprot:g4465.t1